MLYFSYVLSTERNEVLDSFWHLLSTRGLLSHWEYVQTWEVADPLPLSILEVYSVQNYILWEREVERETLWAFRVYAWAVLCQQCAKEKEGRGGWKKREQNTTSSGEDSDSKKVFISIFYNLVLLCAFINMLYFFWFKGEAFVNSFIFGWGVAFLAWLIFRSTTASGFNLRGLYYQKRMFLECLPVTYNPLQDMHAVHVLST